MKIAFLGPRGTFSDEALKRHPLAKTAELMPYDTIPEVIMAAEKGEADYALVPTENSIEGAINVTLDMLVHKVDLQIQEEIILPINHYLLARPSVKFEEVEVIYSHPQPLAQCRMYLEEHFPKAQIRSANSTSAAVSLVAESEEKWAAIGTETAQELYNLHVLAASIQDVDDNNTRFLLLAKKDHDLTGRDKTSIAFSLERDRPGGLAAIMSEFALPEINLTRIESRPSKRNLGEYIFFIDFIGHREEQVVRETLAGIEEKTTFLKILGSYPVYDDSRLLQEKNSLRYKKIAVLGLGLIGASLAGALKRHKVGQEVIGLDRQQSVLEQALARGIIDRGSTDFASGLHDIDILIIATPVGITAGLLKQLLPALKKGCLVTDVGSTKQSIVREIEEFLPPDIYFLGGHPMAGSEKSGIDAANSSIFSGAVYLLTPTDKTRFEDLHLLQKMAELIGSRPIVMPLEEHDAAVSAVSHLPHLLAVNMVRLLGYLAKKQPGIVEIAAGGFRDTTRVASGDPVMWRDIFSANKAALLDTLELFEKLLAELRNVIENDNSQELLEILAEIKEFRDQIPVCRKGMMLCK